MHVNKQLIAKETDTEEHAMRGHIRKRSKDSWEITIDLPRGLDGKRRQKTQTIKGTKKDAEKEITALLNRLDKGAYVKPHKKSVAEYLNEWLNHVEQTNIGRKTFQLHKEHIGKYIVPLIGNISLLRLEPFDIETMYMKLRKSGRIKSKGGLSEQTIKHIHSTLNNALKRAVKWKLLTNNPCIDVDKPIPKKTEMQALDENETAALLQSAKNTRLYAPILVAVTTGLRRGELLALRWKDIDFKRHKLNVIQSVEVTKTSLGFKEPKSKSGKRSIALPQVTVDIFLKHRKEQNEQRLMLGAGYKNLDLVFPNYDGAIWHPDVFSNVFRRHAVKINLKTTRFHDLRHTHATQLLLQGIHPKVVQERLGHSSIVITLDTYSHVLPNMQEEAAEKIDSIFKNAP
jgi:integrase